MLDYIDVLNIVQAGERERVVERKDVPFMEPEPAREAIGKGATTAQKAVRHLREGGYIERVGSNKSGWWRVL